jgi:hypothetical protein
VYAFLELQALGQQQMIMSLMTNPHDGLVSYQAALPVER